MGDWSRDGVLPSLEQTVPEYDSDAFLVTVISKLGWLPFLLVLLVFMVLVIWLLSRCLKQKSCFGKWVTLSVLIMLFLQACCSVIWSFGVPLINTAFPLMVGNVNTVLDLWLIGVALCVFRGESIFRDAAYPPQLQLPRYQVKLVVQKISP